MSLADDGTRRAVLRRIEDQILAETGNRFERLVLLDARREVLVQVDGTEEEVVLGAAQSSLVIGRVALITHNHPGGTTLTDDDVLGAITVGAREIDAFGPRTRFRLLLTTNAAAWPRRAEAEQAIRAIDQEIRPQLLQRVIRRELSPQEAGALHRRLRWARFAQRFAPDVDYVEEER